MYVSTIGCCLYLTYVLRLFFLKWGSSWHLRYNQKQKWDSIEVYATCMNTYLGNYFKWAISTWEQSTRSVLMKESRVSAVQEYKCLEMRGRRGKRLYGATYGPPPLCQSGQWLAWCHMTTDLWLVVLQIFTLLHTLEKSYLQCVFWRPWQRPQAEMLCSNIKVVPDTARVCWCYHLFRPRPPALHHPRSHTPERKSDQNQFCLVKSKCSCLGLLMRTWRQTGETQRRGRCSARRELTIAGSKWQHNWVY